MGAISDPESLACFPYPPSAGASVTGIPGPGFPGGFHGEISGGIPQPGFRGEFPGEKQRPNPKRNMCNSAHHAENATLTLTLTLTLGGPATELTVHLHMCCLHTECERPMLPR